VLVAMIVVMVLGIVVGLVSLFFLPEGVFKVALAVGGFAVPLIVAVVRAVVWLWGARRPPDPRSVDTLADLLAQAVRRQWRKAAAERMLLTPAPIPVRWSLSNLPVTGSVEAAVGVPDWPPDLSLLPGQSRVTKDQLRAGGGRGELFAVYAGIGSGRIVVLGAPGAGKTGTAILLVLDALEHRDHVDDKDRVRVPVPVLFTTSGWDPVTCSVQDWMADRLAVDYPLLFRHGAGQAEAAELVAAGAVTLVLDGLDEMDGARRSAALQALSDVSFRVVVLSRSREMVQASGAALLVGAVALHLHDVTGPEAADYLHRASTGPPPLGWTQLITHLQEHPDSVLTRGLSTPLALTLVRDTYRAGDDVSELVNGTWQDTGADLKQHLIARVLPAAYAPRPGRPAPRYSRTHAELALTFLAKQMNRYHTRDLAWWSIPRWAPTTPRILASMLLGGLLGGLLCAILFELTFMAKTVFDLLGRRDVHGLWVHFGYTLLAGLMGGFGIGLPLGLRGGRGGHEPKQVRAWGGISLHSVLIVVLAHGFVVALGVWLVMTLGTFLYSGGIPQFMLLWTVVGIVVGLPLTLQRNLLNSLGEGQGNPQGPIKNRRKSRGTDLVAPLAAGIAVASAASVAVSAVSAARNATSGNVLGAGLSAGIVVGIVFWLTVWLGPRLTRRFVTVLAEGDESPLGPLGRWRSDRRFGLVVGLVLGLVAMLGFGLGFCVQGGVGLMKGLGYGLTFGLTVGLMYGITSSVTWATTLAWRFQPQLSRYIPAIDLMSFLEDARDRDVLRTAGAVYQFRHASLQDQLAGQTITSPATSLEPQLSS
jgi:hypothetical protein